MYTIKYAVEADFIGGPYHHKVVEDWRNHLEFDEVVNIIPMLVYFDGDIGNENPSTFALLVYVDGDSEWNVVVVRRDFDICQFVEDDESEAMISGPGYPALQTDEGRIVMELIHLVARWNHYDVPPIAVG